MSKKLLNYKSVLILLLATCLLLTSCVANLPGGETTDTNENQEQTTGPSEGNKPTECSHATTILANVATATCAVEGYTGDKVCTACTAVVEQGSAIPKIAHTWNEGETTKNPTCISTGVKTTTCTACGETDSEPIPTVAHSDLYHDQLDGTHTHTCATCTMNENKVHSPLATSEISYPASCLEPAYKQYTCADCNGVYKVYSTAEADAATGHRWGKWVTMKESTCVDSGLKFRECPCGETESLTLQADANKHDWVEANRTAPTCVEDGTVVYRCHDCGNTQESIIFATGVHSYYELESIGDGWTRQECQSCRHQISSFNAEDVIVEVKTDAIPNDTAFGVNMAKANIEFPVEVVEQLKENGNADISIGADVLADKTELLESASKLTDEQKERLNNVEVYDFNVSVNSQKLEQFNVPVVVTMPYELKTGEDPDGIVIWYVADDGEIEEITAVYDRTSGTVSFAVAHFSFYAVAYKETQEMQCRRGHHAYQATNTVVEPSCESYGYTVYECVCCHASTIDDIRDMTNHAYGETIPAQPTCEEGAYDTRVCANCNHVLQIKYVRALGHNPDGVATCTAPSICNTCKNVIKPATGHAWTEWTVVIEPTEVNSGLRRRYCLTCGKLEEVRLAATGNIQEITFDSYQDMMEQLFAYVLNFGNGSIKLSCFMNDLTYDFDVTVNEENDSYLILVDATVSKEIEGQTQTQKMSVLYRNGVVVASSGLNDNTMVGTSDLNTIFNLPFDIYVDYIDQTFNQIDPMVVQMMDQVRLLLQEYGGLYGANIDAALEAIGSTYRVSDLTAVLDSIETVYAYVALKLGYQSGLVMHDGVEIPTRNDLLNVLSAFMTKTQSEGRIDYVSNIEPLLDAVEEVHAWFEERNEKSVAEVFYELFGEQIRESYPELTDFDACVAYVRTNLPGTTTIKNAVDFLISVLEENKIITVEELYELIDECALQMAGEEFDTAKFIAENGSLTLDDFVKAMLDSEDATLDALYEQIATMLKELPFGEVTLNLHGKEIVIGELTEMIGNYLEMLEIDLQFSFAVDQKGNLLELTLNQSVDAVEPGEGSKPIHMEFLNVSIKKDDSVKVNIPALLQPALKNNVSSSYDQAGNLIINGLSPDFDYEFTLNGGDVFQMGDLLTRDDKMSAELGYDVYFSENRAFWDSERTSVSYIKIGDKYYEYSYEWVSGYEVADSVYAWADIVADYNVILENCGAPIGYYTENGEQYPVYDTVLGYVCRMNDGDQLIFDYQTYYDPWYDKETGENFSVVRIEIYSSISLSQAMEYAYVSSMSENKSEALEGLIDYTLLNMNICFDERNYRNVVCYVENDAIYIVDIHYVQGRSCYVLGDEVTELPKYTHKYEFNNIQDVYDKDGNLVASEVVMENFLTDYQVPVYYVKVAEGCFVRINNLCEDVYVEDLETVTLPDGNVMYLLGTDHKSYQRGEMIYGYVSVAQNVYVQVVCFVEGDTILEVHYRDIATTVYATFDQIYNLTQYITKNADGSYTVCVELLNKLKAHCVNPGDSYSIVVSGEMAGEGNVSYRSHYTVGAYMVPDQIVLGGTHGGSESEGLGIDWEYLFGKDDMMGMYQTVINADGSLTIFFRNGAKIDYYVNFGYQVEGDSFLEYNEEKSKETGLQIYEYEKATTSSNHYVYKDGKYYEYSTAYNYTLGKEISLSDLIAQKWRVGRFDYRYDLIIDESTGETIPVYDAWLAFGDYGGPDFYSCGINAFFVIRDGVLYVLTGAVEKGESVLQFEGMVKASEYFTSLSVTVIDDPYTSNRTVYVDGQSTLVYSERLLLEEPAVNGVEGRKYEITVYYIMVDGQKQYFDKAVSDTMLLILGSEVQVTLGDNVNLKTREEDYCNGTFTIASLTRVTKKTILFVKLAGKCYYFDNSESYWSYENFKKEEPAFDDKMAEKGWYYLVWDQATNSFRCYQSIQFESANGQDYAVLSEEFTVPNNWKEASREIIAKTEDGEPIYEVVYYYLDESRVTIEELEDGTAFYHRDGSGYLKGQDGYYVRAYKILREDGSFEIVCSDLDRCYLNNYDLVESGLLDRYVSLDQSNTKITVSKDIFDLINDENRYDFYIQIQTQYNWAYIYYDQLVALFSENQQK